MYSTIVIQTASGSEQRVARWQRGRQKFSVEYGPRTPASMAIVAAFFRARGGKARGFRLKDWTDYTCTDEALTNPYPNKTIQLKKTYTSGGVSEARLIQKPCNNATFVLKCNTVPMVVTTDYSIDYTTGIITLVATPASGDVFTWSGEFDVPVRFDTDQMDLHAISVGGQSWSNIPMIEVLV